MSTSTTSTPTNNNNNNDNSFTTRRIIYLKQSEALKQYGLVTDSVYYIDTNDVKISLNHAINSDIIFTIDKKKWQNNLNTIVEQAEDNGIYDTESKQLLQSHLNDNHEEILADYAINEEPEEANPEKQKIKEITVYKYSELGKGQLHEAVFS